MAGSETRQRTKGYFVRLTPDEETAIILKADRAALHPSAFLRNAALETEAPRAKRRPPADHVALRQLLGHCGRIGNNLNQIARVMNASGQIRPDDLQEALAYLYRPQHEARR